VTWTDGDSVADFEQADVYEPTEAEIEEWAARERQRRQTWLNGPTDEQKQTWARRERDRRQTERQVLAARGTNREASRLLQRSVREMQLAAEGAVSLLFNLSAREAIDQLIQAGRDWEDEFTSQPARPRRVPLEAEPTPPTPPRTGPSQDPPPAAGEVPTRSA